MELNPKQIDEYYGQVPHRIMGGQAYFHQLDDSQKLDIRNFEALAINFENGTTLTFECARNGESLLVKNNDKKFTEIDMGEYGRATVSEIETIPDFYFLFNATINLRPILDIFGRLVGITLQTQHLSAYHILNLGDTLALSKVMPPDFRYWS